MCFETLPLPGADVSLQRGWLAAPAAHALMEAVQRTVPWENHPVRLFGREVPSPRLSAWIGDAGASYRYSGIARVPHPWSAHLGKVRGQLEAALHTRFNSVLANLYRDGNDCMGWHSDNERDLGPQPVIASLSLGATRRFKLRARHGDSALDVELTHGSLLVMAGQTQALYRHALPRTRRAVGPRINLTFRWVPPRAPAANQEQ